MLIKQFLLHHTNLTNILHWLSECELIRIVNGNAQIKIADTSFDVSQGDCIFCSAEELHYIVGENNSLIDIMIFHSELLEKITKKYKPVNPLLSNPDAINKGFENIRQIAIQKPRFNSESIKNCAISILLDIYHNNEICPRQTKKQSDKQIIDKINQNFATISFDEIVSFSGYSPSHFSKVFKNLTGMTFSDYLNYVKIEHAVSLIQSDLGLTITDVCSRCGFSTIRNFNRVFKKIVGFSPRTLPENFATDLNFGVYDNENFNPTSQSSTLL